MAELHETKLKQLELKANQIRQDIIAMLVEAGSGHSAGPLGMADIFSALYFHVLKHDPKHPEWPGRDRLILSNGHICPVRYAAMAHAGYFPLSELKTLRKLGTRLQGHPHRLSLAGLETTSGPLGSGLSQAAGMALALKIDGAPNRVYCAMSDGEHDAGQTWEAVMFAAKYKLNNLTGIIDRNNIQIDGFTEDIMPLDDLKDKYESFNWHVIEINGHNIREFVDACAQTEAIFEKPTVIIARTIPGKGVDFMEGKFEWHGKPPNKEEAVVALRELRTLQGQIEAGHID
ncbi:MAG: transketolase [Candidatus Sungbacteria bacterium]|uniref:Transketolase n=1 Tax=Candidatus Sungiibacteriota bacterium TaxID=2750080 RepID=A0A931YDK2_9BACT|nr:transketolase [Candidatus Sungbacteria bacterium]MBI2465979.1 transketolase [Candidatus Sungbacteria bacterium]